MLLSPWPSFALPTMQVRSKRSSFSVSSKGNSGSPTRYMKALATLFGSAVTTRPPAFVTRSISVRAAFASATWISTVWQVTRSKLSSSKGRRSASPFR